MKQTMRTTFVCLITLGSALAASGQFYPDANALWCGTVLIESLTGFSVQFQMGDSPDTLLSGTAYKRISAFGNASGSYEFIGDYYVRSDVTGKGYVYRPGVGDELLSGDIAAQAGDTVHDVLVAVWDPPAFTFQFRDFVVDSVVLLSNAGVSVTRHYLDPTPLHPFNPFNPISASQVFWQAGMGTAFGPFVIGSSSFYQCVVNDTMRYDLSNNGLPGPGGAGQACWPVSTGLNEAVLGGNAYMTVLPNPSSGLFHFGQVAEQIIVYNAEGRLLFRQSGQEVDLSTYPPGLYHAVVRTVQSVGHVRLVVVR